MRGLPELPPEAAALVVALDAPPRLRAHLRVVYAVARDITAWLRRSHPAVMFDTGAVLFGAATHDIGKVIHSEELSVPGSRHEAAGERLLLERGVPAGWARFAGTHGSWGDERAGVEDWLVSLADKVWKGKRVEDLEQLLVERIAAAEDIAVWEAFVSLDDFLQELTAAADERLAYQNGFPV